MKKILLNKVFEDYLKKSSKFGEKVLVKSAFLDKFVKLNNKKAFYFWKNKRKILDSNTLLDLYAFEDKMLFATIILDIELTSTQFLVGIYFPYIDTYVHLYFYINMDITIYKKLLYDFRYFFSNLQNMSVFNEAGVSNRLLLDYIKSQNLKQNNDSFNLFLNKNNTQELPKDFKDFKCVQALLITYNGNSFDLPLISLFFFWYKSVKL
jgi:hypothetical protein